MLILISYSNYSYSKFEILILHILNNAHNAVAFDSPLLDIYKNHKINMIRIRTLQYSMKGRVFTLLAVFTLFFYSSFVNATTSKTIHFDECFWSHRIIYKYYKYFSKFMNSFRYESNIFRMLWIWYQRCTYLYSLQPALIKQCCEYKWIRAVKFQYCWLPSTQNFTNTYE